MLERARPARRISDDEMRDVRGNDIAMIFQDPMTSLNPVHQGRQADRRGDHAATRASRKREAWKMAVELLAKVGIPDADRARQPVPVRVLGRHAPARHDRHGDLLQPRHPDRRRAHDGARRDHPGADHRRRARDAGAVRLRRHHHHPRPRRRRRDRRQGHGHVRRPHRRVRPRRRDLLQPAPPVHVGPAGVAAAARRDREDAAHAHQGPAAEPASRCRRAARSRVAAPTSARSAATTGPAHEMRRSRPRRALLDPRRRARRRSAPTCRSSQEPAA